MSHAVQPNERHSLGLSLQEAHQGIENPIKGLPLPELKWKNWYVNAEKDPFAVIYHEYISFVDLVSRDPGELRVYVISKPVVVPVDLESPKEYTIKIDVFRIDVDGNVKTKEAIITRDSREYAPFVFTHDTFEAAKKEAERFALLWLTDHRKVIKLADYPVFDILPL